MALIIKKAKPAPLLPVFLYMTPHPFRQLTRAEARLMLRLAHEAALGLGDRCHLIYLEWPEGDEIQLGVGNGATWREWRAAVYHGLTKMKA